MLERAVVQQVRLRLRAGKLGFRQIARALGISHHTVAAIACREPTFTDPPDEEDLGPFLRCPTCGMKVRLPCVACEARAPKPAPKPTRKSTKDRAPRGKRQQGGASLSEAKGVLPQAATPFAPQGVPSRAHCLDLDLPEEDYPDVELEDDHRERYEEVRALRRMEEEEEEEKENAEDWREDEYEDY